MCKKCDICYIRVCIEKEVIMNLQDALSQMRLLRDQITILEDIIFSVSQSLLDIQERIIDEQEKIG